MSYSLTECVPSETASTSSVIIRLRPGVTTAERHEKDMTLTDGKTSYPGFSGVVSGYRLYSPMIERWISRDPIGEKGGVNYYAFCKNSSVIRIDLLGRRCPLTVVNATGENIDVENSNKANIINDKEKEPLPKDVPENAGGWYTAEIPKLSINNNKCAADKAGFNSSLSDCSAKIWIMVNDEYAVNHEMSHYSCLQQLDDSIQPLIMDTGCECDKKCVAVRKNWVVLQYNYAIEKYNVCILTRDCSDNDSNDINGPYCKALIVEQARLLKVKQQMTSYMQTVQAVCK